MKKLFTLSQNLFWSIKTKSISIIMILFTISFNQAFAQEWQMIGGADVTTSLTYCSSMEVSSDGTPYVAFRDATSLNKLSVKKYNGSAWVYVGTAGFSTGIIDHTDIEIDASGVPYVSFTDASESNKARVMKFNGIAWVNVGVVGFSPGTAFGMKLELSTAGLPYVCYIDGTNDKPGVMRFNGTAWVAVGVAGIGMTNTVYDDFSALSRRNSSVSIKLDGSSNIYVAAIEYINFSTRQALVYRFNGTSWSTLPAVGTSLGTNVDISIDPASSQPYLVYSAASQGPLTVKKYDGTTWAAVGSGFTGLAFNMKIDFSVNKPVLAYWDLGSGYKLNIYEFDGTTWNFVGGTVRPTVEGFVSSELGIDGTGNIYVGGFRQSGGGYFQAFKYCTSKPAITLNSPISICGPDDVLLTAVVSPTNVVVNWYADATTNTVLATGVTFTTPQLSADAMYYAEADNKGCASSRSGVIINVKPSPVVSITNATPICGTSGTSTLTATATTGSTLTWYPIANAGLPSGTGSPFTTPVLTQSRNYYLEATLNGCKSTPRTLVTASLQSTVPVITSTTQGVLCGSGSMSISAVASIGTISWYATTTSTAVLGTGGSYTTPVLSVNTTYFAEALSGVCKSVRVPVLAEPNALPTLSNLVVGPTRCNTGSVAMSASKNKGYIQWYNMGGTVLLDTGNTFNTPNISASTAYLVRAFYKGCASAFQSANAEVRMPPTITGTNSASICLGQTTAQLSASMLGSGSIIYYADSTTSTILFSSNNGIYNITPTPTTTQKYFVLGSNSGCDNGIRVPVTLTVKPLPAILTSTPGSRCGVGTVAMSANSTVGTSVRWFLNTTDVNPAFTGASYTTTALSANKTYYLLPTSLNGCSITTHTPIVATINQVPSSVVTISSNTLTAIETGATYQWIDCNTSANISGATAQSFSTMINGDYKVTITKNTCPVTSLCYNPMITAIGDKTINESTILIYPNPSNGSFVIVADENITATILNSLGLKVATLELAKGENKVNSSLSNGLYFINIKNQSSKLIIK